MISVIGQRKNSPRKSWISSYFSIVENGLEAVDSDRPKLVDFYRLGRMRYVPQHISRQDALFAMCLFCFLDIKLKFSVLLSINFYSVFTVYTRKNLTTCQQDVFATGLWQACRQVVTMLLFYQVAITRLSTRNLLTNC
jgi:hypothetical protein